MCWQIRSGAVCREVYQILLPARGAERKRLADAVDWTLRKRTLQISLSLGRAMPSVVSIPTRACRVGQYGEGERPTDAAELANRLLCSVYMGTEVRCT